MSHRHQIARAARIVLGRTATHVRQTTLSRTSAAPCAARAPRMKLLNTNTPKSVRNALATRCTLLHSPRRRLSDHVAAQAQSLRALRSHSKRAPFSNAAIVAAAVSPEPVVTQPHEENLSMDTHVPLPHKLNTAHLPQQQQQPVRNLLADQKITFVGAGKMAGAMLAGIVKSGRVEAQHITACDPHDPRRRELEQELKIKTSGDTISSVANSNIIFIAVKPQTMSRVFQQLKGKVPRDCLVISVVAGYTIDQLQRGFDVDTVIRAMPNTPALINESVTSWTISPEVTAVQRRQAKELFTSFGIDIYLPEEEKIDMATALSGSGPAMCHLMIEAMIDSGVHMGLPRDVAREMVINTVRGAVNLVDASSSHPSMLRNDITSPGGTTAAALYEIEKGGLRTVMTDAVWAAYRRSRELGGLDSCVGPGRFQHYTQLELPEELVENLQQVTESMNDIKELAETDIIHK